MQRLSSEDQPRVLHHAKIALSHELKLLCIHHGDLLAENEDLGREKAELDVMRDKLRFDKLTLRNWRKIDKYIKEN